MEELILKERKFKEKLVETINSSNLPAFIIKPCLKEVFEQVSLLEEQQYRQAKELIDTKKNNEKKEQKEV